MYKETFTKLEKSFRPRKEFKHSEVINQFTELMKQADNEVEYLKSKYDQNLQLVSEQDIFITKLNSDLETEKETTRVAFITLIIAVPFTFYLGTLF